MEIQCRYCRARNEAAEHRCTRCGRRLHLAAPQPGPELYPLASSSLSSNITATATARALDPAPTLPKQVQAQPYANPEPAPKAEPALPVKINYQPSLFREGVGAPKIIPIPTLAPLRPESHQHTSARRVSTRPLPRPRRALFSQQALQFPEAETVPGEMIFCAAEVALPGHRVLAALVDLAWILIAVGLFSLVTFWGANLVGLDLMIDRQTAPFLVAVSVIIAGFYRALWYFSNADTPGMAFAGLQLVDFDGRRPDREQRGLRQIASLLSLVAAGLGLVWALVDEESLTWHDHISKTFPTPLD